MANRLSRTQPPSGSGRPPRTRFGLRRLFLLFLVLLLSASRLSFRLIPRLLPANNRSHPGDLPVLIYGAGDGGEGGGGAHGHAEGERHGGIGVGVEDAEGGGEGDGA